MKFVFLALASFSIAAAAADPSSTPKVEVMKFHQAATIGDLHHTHLLEIKLSEMGKEKSESADVKTMSEHMIQDHQKADSELKSIASKDNVDLDSLSPNEGEKGAMEGLKKLSGPAFDMAYLDFQRSFHKTLAGKLTMLIAEEKDSTLKSYMQEILPTVRNHEKMSATSLAKK